MNGNVLDARSIVTAIKYIFSSLVSPLLTVPVPDVVEVDLGIVLGLDLEFGLGRLVRG